MFDEQVARELLSSGTITAEQLAEAHRTRNFFGGALGSHLLKLGHIDEKTLGAALGKVFGLPYASREQLSQVAIGVIETVKPEFALKRRLCPFRIERRTLHVAMLNPRDAIAVAELRSTTGYRLELWVTSEYRLHWALEKHYGVKPSGVRGLTVKHSRKTVSGQRGTPRAAGPEHRPVEPPGSNIGLDGLPLDAEVSFDDHLFHGNNHDPQEAIPESIDTPEQEVVYVEDSVPLEKGSLEQLETGLANAVDRKEIATALLDFCSARAERCALFAVGREGIRCLEGRGRGLTGDRVTEITIPHDDESVFVTALRDSTKDFYLGPVPPLSANRDLYRLLGGDLPPMVMILPVSVQGRTAAFLYLDNDAGPMPAADLPLMRRVAMKAGLAFQILLLRNKLGQI